MAKSNPSISLSLIIIVLIAIFCGALLNSKHSPVKKESTYTVDKAVEAYKYVSKTITKYANNQLDKHKDILTFNSK